jgi:hypothetical protein
VAMVCILLQDLTRANHSFRLFLIDGVISLPVAVAGFWMLPDVPEIAKPWYLTEKVRPLNLILMASLKEY